MIMNKKIVMNKNKITIEIISTILLLTPFLIVKSYIFLLEMIRERVSPVWWIFTYLLLLALYLFLMLFLQGHIRKKLLEEKHSIHYYKSFSMVFFAIISFVIIYILNSYQAVFYSVVVYPYTIITFIIICVIPFIAYFIRSKVMNILLSFFLYLSYYAFTAMAILGIRMMILYGTAGAS